MIKNSTKKKLYFYNNRFRVQINAYWLIRINMFKQLISPLLLKQPPLVIENGMLEYLKWLALIAMLLDHTNKILLNSQLPFLSEFGRIAMPLFGFVLAYNLARPDVLTKGIYQRMLTRMSIFGIIAQPLYKTALELPHWIPLNIMFTLMLATGIIYLIDRGGLHHELAAITVFILGGLFVEYLWFGAGYCLAAWYYKKTPNLITMLIWILTAMSLSLVNQNQWALIAIPVIFAASKFEFTAPRHKLFFYIFYPLHIAVLLLIKIY